MPQSANLPIFENFPLGQDILCHFRPLCVAVPADEIPLLQAQLDNYVQDVTAALQNNEFLDLSTTRQITAVLIQLLTGYETYTEPQRALIAGATRYVIKQDDAEHDIQSLLGLDDDVKVLNFVLDQLGLSDKKIAL